MKCHFICSATVYCTLYSAGLYWNIRYKALSLKTTYFYFWVSRLTRPGWVDVNSSRILTLNYSMKSFKIICMKLAACILTFFFSFSCKFSQTAGPHVANLNQTSIEMHFSKKTQLAQFFADYAFTIFFAESWKGCIFWWMLNSWFFNDYYLNLYNNIPAKKSQEDKDKLSL